MLRGTTSDWTTHLKRRGHVLYLFVEYLLDAFPHRRHSMFRPIECDTISENCPDILNKFFRMIVTRIVQVRIRFRRIGRSQFPLDGREIHRCFDDGEVMGDIESNGINGSDEGTSIFGFFESAHGRLTEAVLWDAETCRARGENGGRDRCGTI